MKKKYIGSVLFYIISILFFTYYIFGEIKTDFYLSTFGRLFLLGGSCLFCYFGSVLRSKAKKDQKVMKTNLWILFLFYLLLFVTLTLFDPLWGRNGFTIINWSKELLENYIKNSLNLIPFTTIIQYIKQLFELAYPTENIIYNLLGNIICLMPLGIFLPLLFPKTKKTKYFLLTVTLFTIGIELLQFLTLSGSCDIDDVILNVTGAFLMFQIMKNKTINAWTKNILLLEKNKIQKKKLVRIVGILISVILIFFGIVKVRDIFYQTKENEQMKQWNDQVKIIDESETCDNVLEKFYEDSQNEYYFPCTKSDKVYVQINGKDKYLVKDLLNQNPTDYNITIDRLKSFRLDFITKKKFQEIHMEINGFVSMKSEVEDPSLLEIDGEMINYTGEITTVYFTIIPKASGETTLKLSFYDMEKETLMQTKQYHITIDENKKLNYVEKEDENE